MALFRRIALVIVVCVAAAGAYLSVSAQEDAAHAGQKPMLKQSQSANAARAPVPYGQDASAYVLSFAEEFERYDAQVWTDHIWYETSSPVKNYAVEDGMLKIWPQPDANGKFVNRTLVTDAKFEQRYGYFEMEAKLPHGKGLWPAFWLLARPNDHHRPEIDIMEAYPSAEGWGFKDKTGVYRPDMYATTIWLTKDVQGAMKKHPKQRDLSESFHKYAAKWEPNKITFYFDGKPVHKIEDIYLNEAKFILLDLWYGGPAGEPDHTTPTGKSNAFEIKYVRAWRLRDEPASVARGRYVLQAQP